MPVRKRQPDRIVSVIGLSVSLPLLGQRSRLATPVKFSRGPIVARRPSFAS